MTSRLPHPLRNTLQRRLCLDGGLSTTLENLGADLSHGSLWSARLLRDNPDLIVRVHQSFLEAGADVIGSATYQVSQAVVVLPPTCVDEQDIHHPPILFDDLRL